MTKIQLTNLIFAAFALATLPALAQNGSGDSGGTVNGASVTSFFGSGAVVSPIKMEEASIPADQAVSLGPDHNVAAPKPGQTTKPHGFLRGVGRAFAHTANFIGFPVGTDKSVDASLSSDLQNEKNQAAWDQRQAGQAQEAAKATKPTN